MPSPSSASPSVGSRGTLLLLATIAGLSVANIYYIQPLLDVLREAFPHDARWVAIVPAATQLGYATGMFFVAPLGDRIARRTIILWLIAGLTLTLAALAWSPSLLWVAALSVPVGVLSTIAQQAVPFAAEISAPENRGQAVGTVMSGLLLGILLARTAAGIIAEHAGWRAVYIAAALIMLALWFVVAARLPHRTPADAPRYPALLASMWTLFRTEPVLRDTSITGAAMFAAFSAFWSLLALLLAGAPFHMGAQSAGLFGLAGAAGALIAPFAGKSADRRGPRRIISIAIAVTALSFVIFACSAHSLLGLGIGVVVLDAGVQAAQISNQSRIYALRPEARSRLNTVYFVCSFLGGALGSALAALAWAHTGWLGVCAVGLACTAIAGANHARTRGMALPVAGKP
ncbi:MAG: MFS transporter [Janthinobacterium lividum]